MIICLCHGLNSKKLEELTSQGHNTVRQVQEACKAGTTCGACIPEIKKMCHGSPCETLDPIKSSNY